MMWWGNVTWKCNGKYEKFFWKNKNKRKTNAPFKYRRRTAIDMSTKSVKWKHDSAKICRIWLQDICCNFERMQKVTNFLQDLQKYWTSWWLGRVFRKALPSSLPRWQWSHWSLVRIWCVAKINKQFNSWREQSWKGVPRTFTWSKRSAHLNKELHRVLLNLIICSSVSCFA